jgi:hypothetical protein
MVSLCYLIEECHCLKMETPGYLFLSVLCIYGDVMWQGCLITADVFVVANTITTLVYGTGNAFMCSIQ